MLLVLHCRNIAEKLDSHFLPENANAFTGKEWFYSNKMKTETKIMGAAQDLLAKAKLCWIGHSKFHIIWASANLI